MNKNFILIASIVINILFIYIFLAPSEEGDIEGLNDKLNATERELNNIRKKDSLLSVSIDSVIVIKDSLAIELFESKKKRDTIIIRYDEKIDNIISLNADSSVSYLSSRLSEVSID